MTTQFDRALWDVKKSINKVLLVDTFLESALIFLVAYLLISVAGFLQKDLVLIVLGIASVYFVIKSFLNSLADKVDVVGEQYPQLHEELLTAREQKEAKNQVIADLHTEALRHMAIIEEAAFFTPRSTVLKTSAVLVLCLAILLSAPFNLREVPQVKHAVEAIAKTKVSLNFNSPNEIAGGGPSGSGVIESKGELFGEKRSVEEGIVAKKFSVASSNFEVNLNDEEQSSDNFVFDSVFPSEIGTPDPQIYAESIPKEQQELVKNYFRISAEG